MKRIYINQHEIRIFNKPEIVKIGNTIFLNEMLRAEIEKENYKKTSLKECLKKLKSEPLPYAMFRMNELENYKEENIGCEITEKDYYERLEILPPAPLNIKGIDNGFIVNECITENIYEHVIEINGKYYDIITRIGGLK